MLFHAVGEVGESTGHQQRLETGGLGGVDQLLGAGVELEAIGEDTVEVFERHAFEQGHALAQALLVVGNDALHRGFGDGGHFGLAPNGVGNLVHAFDVDERGVHVKRDELEIREIQRQCRATHDEAGGKFVSLCHF